MSSIRWTDLDTLLSIAAVLRAQGRTGSSLSVECLAAELGDLRAAYAELSAITEPDLRAELAVLRAQRDAALAECDAAVAEYDKAAAEATTRDADSPAAAARRGLAGGAFLMATAVRAALGVQPEGS